MFSALRSFRSVACATRVGLRVRQWPAAQARMFSSGLPEHTVIPMPALSPTMTHGTISSWLVGEGDEITVGMAIAEVQTDKATVSFDATDDGYMAKILVEEGGDDIPVGQPCAVVVEDEDDVGAFADYTPEAAAPASAPEAAAPAPTPAAAPAAPVAAPAAPAVPTGDRVFASPFARKLAREGSIDISAVAGTGPHGRIIAADVEEYITSGAAAAAVAAAVEPAPAAGAGAPLPTGAYEDYPHTAMRRVIADRLTEAKRNVPHYYLTADVQLDELMKLRAQLNDSLESKLSVNDFIIKASALALRKVPAVNSSWLDDVVRSYDYVDVSVAVAMDDGLITPVVKDADKLGLAGISSEVRDLAGRAREKKLTPAEYQGGTFTVSNLGMFGVRQFAAIINPPQAAILAVGSASKKVVPNPDPEAEVPYASATVMSVTLSCDHRVVDGAVGAQWLAAFRGYMENPTTMML